jgi:OmcA/MtrC family decaheme c-type cytochrome
MLQNHSKKGMQALFCASMMLSAILLFGCGGGSGGDTGPQGATGPPGPPGPPGEPTTNAESCQVCHTAGKIADIAVAHPDPTGQDVTLSSITLTNTGGHAVVSFHAATTAGPVTNLTFADVRTYMAVLIPAGTATIGYNGVSWGTWSSPYFERWAAETSSTAGAIFDLANAATGDYTYTFATVFGSAAALLEAPDYNPAYTQRLVIRVSGHNDPVTGLALTNNTVGFLDFVVPADGANAVPLDSQRMFVTADACKQCHSPLFQQAAHADGYLDTRACVICHSPLGHYGTLMQTDHAYLPILVHQIHAAIDNPKFADEIRGLGFGAVTYPQDIRNCVACHTNSGLNLGTGDEVDHWKTNPSAETCGSCHTVVNFATGENHGGGIQTDNAGCHYCHPAEANPNLNPAAGASVTEAHDTAPSARLHPTPANIPEFDVTLNITPSFAPYVAGQVLEVRVTLTDHATGIAVPSTVYTTPQDAAGQTGGGLNVASLYVYGPRAKSVPVLATGTVTDPVFDSATDTPTQGHDLFAGGTDPLVTTDSSGFGYRLLAIPADMQAGTYMVRVRMGDYGRVTDSNYRIESTAFQNIQIGTATVEDKVAGAACPNCHGTGTAPFHDARHAVVFDTDQCLSCHDQSGNFAIPIANRVHAVHSANPEGDIYVLNGGSPSSRDWSDVTYPQNIQSPVTGHTADDGLPRCVGCHTSGDTTYKTLPYMMPCVGCHANAVSPINGSSGDIEHMRQNGGPF